MILSITTVVLIKFMLLSHVQYEIRNKLGWLYLKILTLQQKALLLKLSIINDKAFYNKDQAFVFSLKFHEWEDSIDDFVKCLSFEEKQKAINYRTKTLTNRHIISYGVLRYILSYCLNLAPENIIFKRNKYGKPFLDNQDFLYFNTSHSEDIACYIIAFNNAVGIDIEYRNKNMNIKELYDLVLTTNEQEFIKSNLKEKEYRLFFDLWSQKEAVVKAYGIGLSYPIHSLDILNSIYDKEQNKKIYLMQKEFCFEKKIYFKLIDLHKDYSSAIAMHSTFKEIKLIRI